MRSGARPGPSTCSGPWPGPGVTHNFCNTLLDYYRNGGLIPRGPSGGNYTYVMTSPTSTTFLVSAWTQGIRSFDIGLAYEGMLKKPRSRRPDEQGRLRT